MALTNESVKIGDVVKILVFIVTIAGTWYSLQYEVNTLHEEVEELKVEIKTNKTPETWVKKTI